jgi:glutathione S-transferase
MKIYLDPISTTSRALLLFLDDHDMQAEIVPIALFKGEHLSADYAMLNPNKCVPMLDDEGFMLTECSAILKYLAEKAGSPTYPHDLQARARVNAMMDWFNTGFYRDHGYGVVYPQVFPHVRFENPVVQNGVVTRGEELAARWLAILNAHWLQPGPYVCGGEISIADYMGACFVSIGEWVGFDMSPYPAVTAWLDRMKERLSWSKTQGIWNEFTASLQAPAQETA